MFDFVYNYYPKQYSYIEQIINIHVISKIISENNNHPISKKNIFFIVEDTSPH